MKRTPCFRSDEFAHARIQGRTNARGWREGRGQVPTLSGVLALPSHGTGSPSGFLPASVSTRWGAELDLGTLVCYPYPSFTSSVASGSCVRS